MHLLPLFLGGIHNKRVILQSRYVLGSEVAEYNLDYQPINFDGMDTWEY